MAQSAGSYINLMSFFVLSFDSEYVQYMDREDKKVYQEKDLSDFETAMTNDDPSQTFEGYLDYMDRKNALLAQSKLTDEERVSLGEINKRLADYSNLSKAQIEIMQKETQEKIWSLNTGMFDFSNDDLTQKEVEQYKELFDRANKNESVLFQDVVSFDTKALIEAGIYNPYSNELKREPLIMAGRKMMNVLYEKEKLNGSTISVGEIHYNTGHFHVHFATTEVEPTREMIFVKEDNRYERKGQRSYETLEKMKSTFANIIFDRSGELERLNDLRNGLRNEIKTEMATPKNARGSASYCARQFLQLPEIRRKYKRKWQLKQDYLEGYLKGLSQTFRKQVLTNGYELALQVPEVVQAEVEKVGLVPGKDTSHTVRDREAFYSGYAEGVRFKDKDRLGA